MLRAETLAESTPTVDAIITQATVPTGIIQLTVNAFVALPGIRRQHVKILEDITITPAVSVTTTVSTVLGSLSMDAIAIWIVTITAERHAGTLAVSTATCTVADITGVPGALSTHGEHITVCITPSTVLGKPSFVYVNVILLTRNTLCGTWYLPHSFGEFGRK